MRSRLIDELTPREIEVLLALNDGLSTSEIAHKLKISVRTVSTHLDRLRDKTGTRNRVHLLSFCYKEGILP